MRKERVEGSSVAAGCAPVMAGSQAKAARQIATWRERAKGRAMVRARLMRAIVHSTRLGGKRVSGARGVWSINCRVCSSPQIGIGGDRLHRRECGREKWLGRHRGKSAGKCQLGLRKAQWLLTPSFINSQR